jgi:hypothetical protein
MRRIASTQAAYYLATGLWPLVSPRTFQLVTGPKRDVWLVKTVGSLIAVTGVTLGAASRERATLRSPAITALAVGNALSLAAVDCMFVARRRISRVYLVDAVAELALVSGWLLARTRRDRQPT